VNDYKPLVGRRVLVFTEFLTFEGTLQRAGRDSLILEHASAVADDGGRKPIDGEALIPAHQVQWVQVP
jgi:hypothetical protein